MLQLGKQPAAGLIQLTVRRGARPGNSGRQLKTSVVLAKRHLASSRPPYAMHVEPAWRGLQVDYATALPPALLERALQDEVPVGSLAVTEVKRGSPAWNAGARAGMILTHVDDLRVTTPEEFQTVARLRDGKVRIRLASGSNLTVAAE
jgi:S1-C subfamily serine protease